jgi:small multidrug resistance pump
VKWALLAAAIGAEMTASSSLKGSIHHPWLIGVVVVAYVVSYTLIAMVLRRGVPLGVVYAMWGALGVAGTAVLSAVLFNEAVSLTMGVGFALLIAGVVLVELGSQLAERHQEAI